jgi:predicted helicase
VYHADLWGARAQKYEQLFEQDVAVTDWVQLNPQSPFYLFTPQNVDLLAEYNRGWKLTEAIPLNVLGFQTHRDTFAVDFEYDGLRRRIEEMRDTSLTDEEFRQKHNLRDNQDWQLAKARIELRNIANWENFLIKCSYRPFDWRYSYFTEIATDRPRRELKEHVAGKENLCILSSRQQGTVGYRHAWVAKTPANDCVVSTKSREANQVFPLYLYPTENAAKQKSLLDVAPWPADEAHGGRTPNLNPEFVAEMAQKLGLAFTPNAAGDLQTTFGPEEIFHYIYAIFHSPTYRSRYAEFLKIDFPRVPITSDVALFRSLCGLGKELVGLHLLESPQVGQFITRYPVAGDNRLEKGYPKYVPPQNDKPGRIHINKSQFFEGISPEVWEFLIGGYQVLDKWLKDRQGRQLSHDDLTHYQQVAVALQKTIEWMEKIDDAIPKWPVE